MGYHSITKYYKMLRFDWLLLAVVMIDRYINTLCCNHINFKVRQYQWALLKAGRIRCRRTSGGSLHIYVMIIGILGESRIIPKILIIRIGGRM